MPVSKISSVGSRASKSGAGRWIGQRSTSSSSGEVVDRLADDVHEPTERLLADGDRHRLPGVGDHDPAREPVGRVHGDGADLVVAEVLLHLADQLGDLAVALQRDRDRVVDRRELVREVRRR